MTDTADDTKRTVETVDTGQHHNAVSDPALADTNGADWSSEGGATVDGPATHADTED